MNRQMLRRNGASVYIERGMSFKSFFLNKMDLNSYMCFFIFIFALTVTAEEWFESPQAWIFSGFLSATAWVAFLTLRIFYLLYIILTICPLIG